MSSVKKVVLDVLKPHQPNAIDFAQHISRVGPDFQVKLVVLEMDEKTETLRLEISGASIDFQAIQNAIQELGGSLHSIDEVEVSNDAIQE